MATPTHAPVDASHTLHWWTVCIVIVIACCAACVVDQAASSPYIRLARRSGTSPRPSIHRSASPRHNRHRRRARDRSAMYPKPEDGPATGFPMSGGVTGGGGGRSVYYHAPGAGAATAAFAMQAQAQAPLAAWSTGLCDCFDDCSNCCVTCVCPCVTFGQIAEIIDRGSTSCGASGALYALIMCLTGCQCVYSCFYRAKMRAHYGLQESPCADCCIHWCCEPCALCQEYRELKKRGFDMNLGWHANMERQGRTPATMPPLMHPGMTR